MAWKVEFTPTAENKFRKLDSDGQKRILRFLRERVANQDDPRSLGKALVGHLSGVWRYRVGTYRVLCHIEDERVCVVVVTVGHRKNVYGGH